MQRSRFSWGIAVASIALRLTAGVIVPASLTGSDLPKPPALTFPPAEAASRQQARDLAPRLLTQIEPAVAPQLRAAAEDRVAHRDPACPIGKAWDDFGLAMLLQGDAQTAAWCGLHAIEAQWTAPLVTNCAVYLIYLGRPDDALVLLNCAYAMGYHSPYLFEALARIHRKKGDRAQTTQWITLAAQEAPDDALMDVEQSLAQTGAPPSPKAPNTDPLDQALAELKQHVARVTQAIRELSGQLDQIENDPRPKEFRDQLLAIEYGMLAKYVGSATDAIQRSRMTAAQYQETVGRGSGPFNEEGFKRYLAMMRNQAFLSCIENYYLATQDLLRNFSGQQVDGPGWHALFWGEVLYMNPSELEQEQKLEVNTDFAHRGELYDRDDASWTSLDHGPLLEFSSAVEQSNAQWIKDRQECSQIKNDPAAVRACQIRADKAQCDRIREAYATLAQAEADRYDGSAHHFDLVARSTMMWGRKQLLDFRDYAQRYFRLLNLHSMGGASVSGRPPMNEAQMYTRVVNTWWKFLRDEVMLKNHPTHSLAKYLREEAEWWVRCRAAATERLAQEKSRIETGSGPGEALASNGCAKVDQKYLELLAQEEWEEYLEKLRENLGEDFEAKYNPDMDCNLTLGPLSFSMDESGKVNGSYKMKDALGEAVDLTRAVSTKDGKFAGVEVSAGADAGEGVGITVGGDATVFTERNERTGQWDAGFGVTGKVGLGASETVSVFGHDVGLGIACYPGSVSAKFFARAAFDDAVAMVQAAINGPGAHSPE